MSRKNLITSIQVEDYLQAYSDISNVITEQEQFYPNLNTQRNFNFGENRIMKHMINHLEGLVEKGDSQVIEKEKEGAPTIKNQSDLVIEIIDYQPKSDYTNNEV